MRSEPGEIEAQEQVSASVQQRPPPHEPASVSPPCSPVHPPHPAYLAPPPSSLSIDAFPEDMQQNQVSEDERILVPNEDDVIVLDNRMTPAEAKRLTKNQLMDELRERNLPFRANEKKPQLCDRLIAAL